MALEEEFGISRDVISDEDIYNIATVGDILNLINSKIK
jgi:acyl carrier protein